MTGGGLLGRPAVLVRYSKMYHGVVYARFLQVGNERFFCSHFSNTTVCYLCDIDTAPGLLLHVTQFSAEACLASFREETCANMEEDEEDTDFSTDVSGMCSGSDGIHDVTMDDEIFNVVFWDAGVQKDPGKHDDGDARLVERQVCDLGVVQHNH